MAVAADHAAVDADLADVKGRYGGKLCGQEVLFPDAVRIVQQAEHRQLDAVLAFVGIGDRSDQDMQALARDALGHGLLHLILRQVGQQVGDDEFRLVLFPPQGDVHALAGFQCDRAVQLQRDRHPLILFDAAVVMGAEIAELILLVERDLLEVQAGRVDVGPCNDGPLGKTFLSDDGKHHCLSAVHAVNAVAGLQRRGRVKGAEAGRLSLAYGQPHGFAFDAGFIQKFHVAAAVVLQLHSLLRVQAVIAVLRLKEQGFTHIFHF